MIGVALRLAEECNSQLRAILIGYRVQERIEALVDYGINKFYVIDNKMLSGYSLDLYSSVLTNLIRKYDPFLRKNTPI